MNLQVVQSKPADLSAVLALLNKVSLPTEGVAEHFSEFLIAQANERVVGCVGLERYGSDGLLRSLAVAPDFRGQGVGLALTSHMTIYAKANAIRSLTLLTTTAADFFALHFGFVVTDRGLFHQAFHTSSEWGLPRCSSAVCMTRTISD